YLIYSFDGGLNWSIYFPISDSTDEPNIAYRDGILHFAGSRDYKIIYTRSTDLGNSWSTPTIITAPNTVLPKRPVLALGPNQNVYIAWTDNKYSGMMQFDDVLFRKSTDDGLTWGPEQRLTPDSHCDAGGALDMVSQNSMIFIVWKFIGLGYPTPCSLFFLASTDCGETWRPRETIKEGFNIGISDPDVAVAQDYVYVIWRDNQYGPTDEVSMRRGRILLVGIEEEKDVSVSRVMVYPNPFSKEIQIRYMIPDAGYRIKDFSIRIFDVSGKEVVLKQGDKEAGRQGEIKIDTKDLSCGVYFVEVKAGNERIIKKVVKVR
ncbi:MAG: T9SS type A sorting domain-containing protein, partial [candidate division WOR-3 bacterium]